jgi:multidrug resistance efflux pump
MDSIQGKLSLLRLQLTDNDATDQHREAMDFERLRLDWLLEKVNLTTTLTKAKKATMDLEIARSMDVAPASSKRYLQEAELLKQAADAEVTERQDLVDSLGIHIKELSTTITPSPAAKDDLLVKEVSSLEARLIAIEQSQSVLMLRAPMDGMVTEVLRRDGENLVAGEALIIITATRPESIIGYLRQPLPLEPEVGQEVEVRTHGRERLRGLAVVTRVGSHFEPILNAALHPSATAEVGVPLEVSLPANLKLRPGELVSLVIRPTPVN